MSKHLNPLEKEFLIRQCKSNYRIKMSDPAPQTAHVTPLVWLIPLVLFIIVLLVLLRRKKGKE